MLALFIVMVPVAHDLDPLPSAHGAALRPSRTIPQAMPAELWREGLLRAGWLPGSLGEL